MTDGVAIHAMAFDTGIGQASRQSIADDFQIRAGGLAAHVEVCALDAAIDDQSHSALLASPGQLADRSVLEQAAGFGDGGQMLFHQLQIQLGEGGAFGPRLDVVVQVLEIIVPIGFVLGVELDHPGRCFQFVEGVLQRVFQCVADFA